MCKNILISITIGSPFVGAIRISSNFSTFNGCTKRLHRFFTQISLHAMFFTYAVTLY